MGLMRLGLSHQVPAYVKPRLGSLHLLLFASPLRAPHLRVVALSVRY